MDVMKDWNFDGMVCRDIPNEKTLLDLPFRVVVTDILSYFQYNVDRKSEEEFFFFGYFRNDRSRKIFFLFSSIYFWKGVNVRCVIDFRQVRSMYLSSPKSEFYSNIVAKHRSSMNKIHRLTLYDVKDIHWDHKIFTKEDSVCFPKLKQITLFNTKLVTITNTRILKRLRILQVYNGIQQNNPHEILSFEIPNVEILEFSNCPNRVDFITGENLRTLIIGRDQGSYGIGEFHEDTVLSILQRSPNLQKLVLSRALNFTENHERIFLSSSFLMKLKELRLSHLGPFLGENRYSFTFSINKLSIEGVPTLNDKIFQENNFSQLEFLRIERGRIDFTDEDIFQETSRKLYNFTGLKWRCLSNLKTLIISSMFEFRDSFFRDFELKRLEHLQISSCLVSGRDWQVFESLKTLKLFENNNLDDILFQQCCFPSLKCLWIRAHPKLKGIGWKFEFSKVIEEIRIWHCDEFKDFRIGKKSLFRDPKEFGNLKEIHLDIYDELMFERKKKKKRYVGRF